MSTLNTSSAPTRTEPSTSPDPAPGRVPVDWRRLRQPLSILCFSMSFVGAIGTSLGSVVAGQLAPFALPVTFAITLVYVWLFNHTAGSVLLTMVFHIVQGTGYAFLGFAGADAVRMDWLTGALWCLLALGIVALDRPAWRAAPPSAVASPNTEHVPA